MSEQQLQQLASSFPLGRFGQPIDIAQAALFLASEASSWITGVTLDIAGGKSCSNRRHSNMPVIKASERQGSSLKGADHEVPISLILDRSEPGQGPRLHRHPYDETWVVQEGNITFQLGDDEIRAGPGDIVIAPPGVPHKFTNDGPRNSNLVCIHASPTIIGEWLE